jgi:hypothetical protein
VALLLAALVESACDLQPFAAPSPSARHTCAPLALPSPTAEAPTGKIRLSGIVRSAETCAGIEDVVVIAYAAHRGAVTIASTEATGSDGSGLFTLYVPTGIYHVLFIPPDGSGLASRWWPREPTYLRALSIDAARDGLDMQLPKGFTISGNVMTDAGAPARQSYIRVSPSSDTYDFVTSTNADRDGHYSVTVTSGIYRVQFFAPPPWVGQWWKKRASYANADDVVVAAKDVGDVSVILSQGRTVSGRVAAADATPVEDAFAFAALTTTTNWCCEFVAVSGSSSADGVYRLALPEGTYRIGFLFSDPDGRPYALWWPGPATAPSTGMESSRPVVVDRDRSDIDLTLR